MAHGRNTLALRSRTQPRRTSKGQATGQARGPVSRALELDTVDRGIIEALQSNGRESFRRIAVSVGVSEAVPELSDARDENERRSFERALEYMDLEPSQKIATCLSAEVCRSFGTVEI